MKTLKKTMLSTLAITLCASLLLSSEITIVAYAVDEPNVEPTIPEEIQEELPEENTEEPEKKILAEIDNKRNQYDKHFRLGDGSMMAVQYAIPVHFKEDSDKWTEYDNRLDLISENGIEIYKNRKSDIDVRLSKTSSDENMVSLDIGDSAVGWGYADVDETVGVIVKNDETLKGNDKFTVLQNVVSRINYENIYHDVDAEYYISSVGVKENLVLRSEEAQRSFTINYNIGELSAKQTDEHTITLTKNGKEVYTISAPCMTDADGDTSDSLSLSIISQNEGQLSVLLQADDMFFDEDCSYPVVVDPYVNTDRSNQLESTFANSNYPNSIYGGENSVNYIYTGSHNSGQCYSFIQVAQLPDLNSGDIIVHSEIDIYLSQLSGNFQTYPDAYVNAYEVAGSWDQSALTWNNKPAMYPTVIDYNTFTSSSESMFYSWDITNIVKKWYDGGNNYGIGFKNSDDPSSHHGVKFYSLCAQPNENLRPFFVLDYLNNKGIEDYWTYTSFDVGTAGTAYVNNYSGNLVFVHNDSAINGENNTFTLQHIYNSCMANDLYNDTKPYLGKGWKLNTQETIKSSSLYGLDNEALEEYPYVYMDGDGTEHYIYKTTFNNNVSYFDEDGLGLELTGNPSSTVRRFVLTDLKDSQMEFNSDGRLRRIIDANDNVVGIDFNSNEITSIFTKSAEHSVRRINLTKYENTDFLKETIAPYDPDSISPNIRKMVFDYSGQMLSNITNPDGTNVTFDYYTDGVLKSVEDIDGYKIEFEYTNASQGRKVSSIQEYAADGTAGQKITFSWDKLNTTKIRNCGNDGIYDNGDDVISEYQFDQYGRTLSVHNRTSNVDLGAYNYTYTDGTPDSTGSNIKQLNRVSSQHINSLSTRNYITNGSFERDGGWRILQAENNGLTVASRNNTEHYFGKYSQAVTNLNYSQNTKARVIQDIASSYFDNSSDKYTVSAYVKTTAFQPAIIQGEPQFEPQYGAGIAVTLYDSSGIIDTIYSDLIKEETDIAIEDGWRRVSVSFTVPSDMTKARISLMVNRANGTAFFDGVQLEKGETVNNYNLLENSSFEETNNAGMPVTWTPVNCNSSVDNCTTDEHLDRTHSFKFGSDQTKEKTLSQSVIISGEQHDSYIVSGWVKNACLKDNMMIRANVYYDNNNSEIKTFLIYNSGLSDWQYYSASFDLTSTDYPTANPASIEISLIASHQGNDTYFDDLQLIKDNAQSYTFNSDGNITNVLANDQIDGSMVYSGSDLSHYTDANQNESNYTYDTDHNVTSETNPFGVTSHYTYNDYGNVTENNVTDDDQNPNYCIKTTTQYTNNNLFTSKSSDEDGYEEQYTNNKYTGNLEEYKDKNNNITYYEYNSDNDLIESITKGNVTVTFGYTPTTYRNLTSISNGNVSYSLSYDKFNNIQQAKVNNITLASYTYGSNNGQLSRLTYGNGDYLDYAYDSYGEVNSVKQNGQTAFKWVRDNTGKITKFIDFVDGKAYNSTYDTVGRLVGVNIRDNTDIDQGLQRASYARINYGYDKNNNVTTLINTAGGSSVKTGYEYREDDLPDTVSINGVEKVKYSYDSLERLTQKKIELSSNIITSYTYKKSARNDNNSNYYQTSKIETENIGGNLSYKYSYDQVGNITEIKRYQYYQYVPDKEYTYDSFNQMTSEKDYNQLTEKVYSYDNAGNITSVTTYSIDTNGDRIVPAVSTQTYQYTDGGWKDKLTIYGNTYMTYDAIGNPLTYRDGMTMTWQNGRELATLVNGNKTMSYTYGADGLRTTKLLNSTLHTYEYVGGQLLYETRGAKKIHYIYDSYGNVLAAIYKPLTNSAEETYYYAHNWRGDVVALYDSTGSLFARYDYDAWGKPLSVKDANGSTITNAESFAIINPIRYRGYFYDTESGLYYLQSRYYDPTTGRFVNGDSFEYIGASDSIKNYNLFAYCDNNPVILFDPDGTIAITTCVIIGACIGAVVGAIAGAVVSQKIYGSVNGWWVLGGAVGGAVVGGVLGYVGGALFGASGIKAGSLAAKISMAKVRWLGNIGERIANITKNTKHIESLTGTAKYRIPDILVKKNRIIGDVKNVKYLSYTNQLKDFMLYAEKYNYTFVLIVRRTTQLSSTIKSLVDAGKIVLYYL